MTRRINVIARRDEVNESSMSELRQSHAVEDVVASNYTNQTVTGSDVPDDVVVDEMSGSHFQFLGLRPILGRYIMPTDAPDGQDPQPVAVLSHKFWQRHYRGDPVVVGKTIQLNRKSYTILGVMPVRFTWRDGDVYIPLKMESDQTHRYSPQIKLKPGVSFAAASEEFQPLYQEFDKQTPNTFPKQFKISVAQSGGLLHPRSQEDDVPALRGRRAAARYRLRQRLDSSPCARHGPST